MSNETSSAPPLPIRVDLDPPRNDPSALRALPAAAGVFALEDEAGRTLSLAVTADLRRLVRARLAPIEEADGPTRRVDYGAIARAVRATTVGSAFEADWTYLAQARRRLPATFRSLLDRWRGWFIHANPAARFPRLVKTAAPGTAPTGATGEYIGPYADKHAAQRVIEALQDGFDLCRYHHILVESPGATACAYKEMGRCPAPCDGTIGMDEYRAMIGRALEYAADPGAGGAALRGAMAAAAEELRFEEAQALRRRLDALVELSRPAQRHAGRLESFRYVAVLPSDRAEVARLYLIVGGAIAPFCDVPLDADRAELEGVAEALERRARAARVELTEQAVENIGLVCWHLLQSRRTDSDSFIHLDRDGVTATTLRRALRRLRRGEAEAISEAALEG